MLQGEAKSATCDSTFRAFLSHSSIDKEFVMPVARRLGRRRVKIDQWEFETGDNFIASIRAAMGAAGSFVLFASQNSLKSLWVKFEMQEAEELLRADVLKSALVLIIDRDTRPADLPKWMHRVLVDQVLSPNAAARSIEHHLNKLRGVEHEPLFFGRGELLAEFSEKLIPEPETTAPHILILGGLQGIGRRTFLQRALKDFLSLRMGPVFNLRPTDGFDVLHLALLDELGTFDTKAQIAVAIEQFQASPTDEKAKTIAQMLASSTVGNVATIIVDDGALLDSSGRYTSDALSVFHALQAFPEATVAVLHTRRPTIADPELRAIQAVYTRVPPLTLSSTKLLLTQSLRKAEMIAASDQVSEIAHYLEGYPPAVSIAVSLAKEYGIANVVADKSGLVDFQIRTFAGVMEKLRLDEREWAILRILAAETVMPLEGLAGALEATPNELAKSLRRLTDLNLVLPSGVNFAIAFPVRFAVHSLRGRLSAEEFGAIGRHLKAAFWDNSDQIPPLEVIEATIHAVIRSDASDLSDFKGFVVPSMLYRSAKEYYDRGRPEAREQTRKLLSQLLKLDPEHKPGLILLCKTQVRLTEWAEAEHTLADIRARRLPEQHFLAGFLLWKQGAFAKAVTAFRTALALGQTAVEVYHGLATCLFRLNNLAEAEKEIQDGLRWRRPNSLLLDLAAQIAIARGNYIAAESYIDHLRRLRADTDYHHRSATLFNARKQFAEALPHAQAAVDAGGRRRFEVEATLADTLIEVRDFPRASQLLDELDKRDRFGSEKRDIRLGLRCKLHLRQHKWKQAEDLWKELADHTRAVTLALRREILQQKIDDLTTTPGVRAEAKAELERLKAATMADTTSDQISLFTAPDEESADGTDDNEQDTTEHA